MVQLTLNLKSNRPSTVYSYNGKSYKLQPGSNTLNLEYEDYLALAKALSIKPVANDTSKNIKEDPIKEEQVEEPAKEEHKELVETPVADEVVKEPEPIKEEALESNSLEEAVIEKKESSDDDKEPEAIDYSTWSYTKLKAKYKSITGNSCKLKKDEVIAFLQEYKDAE